MSTTASPNADTKKSIFEGPIPSPPPPSEEPMKAMKMGFGDIARADRVVGSPSRDRRRIPTPAAREDSPTRYSGGSTTPLVPDDEDDDIEVVVGPHASLDGDVEMSGPGKAIPFRFNRNPPPGNPEGNNGNNPFTPSQINDYDITGSQIADITGNGPNGLTQAQMSQLDQSFHDAGVTVGGFCSTATNDKGKRPMSAAIPIIRPNAGPSRREEIPVPRAVFTEFPKPTDPARGMNALSTRRNECPNGKLPVYVPSEEKLACLIDARITFSDGNYDQFVRNREFYVDGIPPEKLVALAANPECWAALTIFNSGREYWKAIPEAVELVKKCLTSLGIEPGTIIAQYLTEIASIAPRDDKPEKKGKKGKKSKASAGENSTTPGKYTGVKTILVEFYWIQDRNFLCFLRTIGVSPGLGMHINFLKDNEESWATAAIRTDQLSDDEATQKLALWALKEFLFASQEYHALCARLIAGPEPTPEKVLNHVNTFFLQLQPYKYRHIHIDWPVWMLFTAPVSSNMDPLIAARENNEMRRFIRGISHCSWSCRDTGASISIYLEAVECTICKSDTHNTFKCTFASLPTWNGPREQVSLAVKAHREANPVTRR
ncbi:hypothetical protein BT96DRAFT_1008636 [Gymnopus androsaceus JB14]|uniref:Uncharacterized protein n=1 Tax=Gymnopus androsaceus JB14 TaxID=1447944 RepID=A0A6A4GEB6_9AGAR|nr:hypothetical protein BT96DRAFT_1008636 [Gymnopus androsaceus JB14]